MSHTIRIPKPKPPLPPLPRTARVWVPRDQWGKRAAERAVEPSVAKPLDIGAKLRRLLMGEEG